MPCALFWPDWLQNAKYAKNAVGYVSHKNIKERKINIDMKYEVGILEETIREYMREFDLLVIGKGVVASDTVLEILKENYKSLLIIGDKKTLNISEQYFNNICR